MNVIVALLLVPVVALTISAIGLALSVLIDIISELIRGR